MRAHGRVGQAHLHFIKSSARPPLWVVGGCASPKAMHKSKVSVGIFLKIGSDFVQERQGKFMLNIAFGQSKYYVDNLSENVKRGLSQKVRRGEYPGVAPTGYLNNKLTKKMVPDPERFHLVKKLFELYATGKYSIKEVRKIITEAGLRSRNGKILSNSNIQAILKNPFYYGAFKFNGELYQGNHEPMITKKLFDKCQQIMADRSRPKKRGE